MFANSLRLLVAVTAVLLLVPRLPAGGWPPAEIKPAEGEDPTRWFGHEPIGENGEDEEESPFADAIETDRDSFTPATRTVGRGRLVLESAYSFLDNRGIPETHSFPELLLRYGLTKRLELRLGWNCEVGGGSNDVSGSGSGGEEDFLAGPGIVREYRLAYGIKAALTEQCGAVPDSIVIVQGFTPTGGESNDTQVAATYALGWKLPNRWKFDAAIRYGTASEEEDRFGIWAPSAVLKVPVGERINIHGEYFGLFSCDKANEMVIHYLSPGIHFLLTPDLEVGVRVGWGLNDESARFFTNAGFGLRF